MSHRIIKSSGHRAIDKDDGRIIVRRVDRYSSEDLHKALFPQSSKPRTLDEMKEGIRQYMKGRYARR
jgi:hypothetical protein